MPSEAIITREPRAMRRVDIEAERPLPFPTPADSAAEGAHDGLWIAVSIGSIPDERTASGYVLLRADHDYFLSRLGALLLDPTSQVLLALQRHQRVLLRDLCLRVPGDLRRLDAAGADLLPPGNIGAAKTMRPKTR